MSSQYFTVSFQSETTIYQKEYRCHVSENDFNYTTNPSAIYGTNRYANAKGSITIANTFVVNTIIDVYVDDPELGTLLLGSYTIPNTPQSINSIAYNLGIILSNNQYGYIVFINNNQIIIEARNGLGASINGGTRLSVNITYPDPIFDDTFDITFN